MRVKLVTNEINDIISEWKWKKDQWDWEQTGSQQKKLHEYCDYPSINDHPSIKMMDTKVINSKWSCVLGCILNTLPTKDTSFWLIFSAQVCDQSYVHTHSFLPSILEQKSHDKSMWKPHLDPISVKQWLCFFFWQVAFTLHVILVISSH